MARVQLLLGAGVVPVVVFDGGRLPNKDEEEKNRHRCGTSCSGAGLTHLLTTPGSGVGK